MFALNTTLRSIFYRKNHSIGYYIVRPTVLHEKEFSRKEIIFIRNRYMYILFLIAQLAAEHPSRTTLPFLLVDTIYLLTPPPHNLTSPQKMVKKTRPKGVKLSYHRSIELHDLPTVIISTLNCFFLSYIILL